MRAAQFWAGFLREQGVTRIFGHPGTELIELLEAARGEDLEFVLTQHEATAGFMAAMTGKLTGVPGVCVTTAGPGATNAASAIAQAFLDRMPLLVVAGDHTLGPGQPLHQRLAPDLYAKITRATIRLTAANIAEELPHAFVLATTHPHGPVYMTFPTSEMMTDLSPAPAIRRCSPGEERQLPSLVQAEGMLAASERPMTIAGLGVANAHAEAEFLLFATALGTPVADTPQSKGCIPTDHPLYVGTFGTHRDGAVADLANGSDLIVTVGLDSVEFLKPWRLTSPVLALASVGAGDDPAIPAKLTLEAPLRPALAALAATRSAGRWRQKDIARYRTEFMGSITPPVSDEGRGRLWPQTVVAELQKAMPEDGLVAVDVGSHKLLMVLQWVVRRPVSFLCSSGLSSMGTGIPFALAAKLVHPSRPVAAVVGDGGFLMYAGELAAIRRIGAPIVVVVMADQALYSIKIKQVRKSYPATGTELGHWLSVAEIARGFGVRAERVTTATECAAALRGALGAREPTVIEAVIDPEGYELSQ